MWKALKCAEKNTQMGVKDFSFLIKDFSIVKTCQCLVKITVIETWENGGRVQSFTMKNSLFLMIMRRSQ